MMIREDVDWLKTNVRGSRHTAKCKKLGFVYQNFGDRKMGFHMGPEAPGTSGVERSEGSP